MAARDCAFAAGVGALVSRGASRFRSSQSTLPARTALWRQGANRNSANRRARTTPLCTVPLPSEEDEPLTPAAFPEGSVSTFTTDATTSHMRLDKALSTHYPHSRAYFHTLISDSAILVNGSSVRVTKSRKLEPGDVVRVTFSTPLHERPLVPEAMELSLLYEDEHLAVVDKAAGVVVHPAPGHWSGTLAHGLAYRYRELADAGPAGGNRNGIVHRLDRGTSGALVVARTREAHEGLARLFADREVRKEYLTVTIGSPAGDGALAGSIDLPIGRDKRDRLKMAVIPVDEGGRAARSTFEVLGKDDRGLLHVVRVLIESGRTHQIRVHMRHRRAPVLGDPLYGALDINRRFKSAAGRPMLHAARVAFVHPITGETVDVTAPIPDDFRELVAKSIDPAMLRKHPEWEARADTI